MSCRLSLCCVQRRGIQQETFSLVVGCGFGWCINQVPRKIFNLLWLNRTIMSVGRLPYVVLDLVAHGTRGWDPRVLHARCAVCLPAGGSRVTESLPAKPGGGARHAHLRTTTTVSRRIGSVVDNMRPYGESMRGKLRGFLEVTVQTPL